jgi:selT/selW/selH-like putative selenoprotein
VDSEIVPGARGAFEVYKDGTLVYSKLSTGKFPLDQEVLTVL